VGEKADAERRGTREDRCCATGTLGKDAKRQESHFRKICADISTGSEGCPRKEGRCVEDFRSCPASGSGHASEHFFLKSGMARKPDRMPGVNRLYEGAAPPACSHNYHVHET
jgi:hypothetical protein